MQHLTPQWLAFLLLQFLSRAMMLVSICKSAREAQDPIQSKTGRSWPPTRVLIFPSGIYYKGDPST